MGLTQTLIQPLDNFFTLIQPLILQQIISAIFTFISDNLSPRLKLTDCFLHYIHVEKLQHTV